MEIFLTNNGIGEWNCSSTKNTKKGSERDDRSLTKREQNRTEQNKNGKIRKKGMRRNDLAEGPRSRTELNDFKKVGTCPALETGMDRSCAD